MSHPHFFEPEISFQQGYLGDENQHHALHVLRMKSGDPVRVTNGSGSYYDAVIKQVNKKECILEKGETITEPVSRNQLQIGIAFTKNAARMEWFLEKATEMGIHSIIPLITKRSERSHFKKERFEKIMIAAMLQSQQYFLPVLQVPAELEQVVQTASEIKCIAYCGNEYEKKTVREVLNSSQSALILIGPEGDFSADEVHLCVQHQFVPVSLGAHRLRTETAGLYVCSIFNAFQ